MRSVQKHVIDQATKRIFRHIVFCVIVIAAYPMLIQVASAQCLENPGKNTAIKFNNETSFDLTFFIDEDEKGAVVASGSESIEFQVEPGEHLLRARASLSGETLWVWTVNEIPAGHVCRWTVTDPQQWIEERNIKYRSPDLAGNK